MEKFNVKYLIKLGFLSVWKNRLMTFVSVGILVACLLIMGFGILFTVNINAALGDIEAQTQIVVFMKENISKEKFEEFDSYLLNMPELSEVVFVSKEQAFEDEKIKYGEDAYLLEGLEDDNPLPDSYILKIKNISMYNQIEDKLALHDDVIEKYSSKRHVIQKLQMLHRVVNIVSYSIVTMLLVISLFIIINTIKLAMFVRQREINIMKYVGATDNFIRLPFIIEGFILGVMAAVIAYAVIWYGYNALNNWLSTNIWTPIPFDRVSVKLILSYLISSVMVGITGSVISIRKYMKV